MYQTELNSVSCFTKCVPVGGNIQPNVDGNFDKLSLVCCFGLQWPLLLYSFRGRNILKMIANYG